MEGTVPNVIEFEHNHVPGVVLLGKQLCSHTMPLSTVEGQ